MIPSQTLAVIPTFTLESDETLRNVPVAYTTRGVLSPEGDNAMVICHALSGSADVSDWWGPLLGGPGRAFDISRFFVVCINCLGSPYGTASPVTAKDGDDRLGCYGPEFPLTTIRDDVRLSKLLLDDLGVKQIAAAVGGSMGGMLVLEFAYFGRNYVKCIVPIATSATHSAWCISWGEAQRQSIYSDPKYEDGYYGFDDPPTNGLGAARMQALLTYRSRDSFESRFGRNTPNAVNAKKAGMNGMNSANGRPSTPSTDHFAVHNEGHRNAGSPRSPATPSTELDQPLTEGLTVNVTDPQFHGTTEVPTKIDARPRNRPTPHYFSAQSYLRYQRDKFNARFDANCYIAVTRKLDTHDVSYHSSLPSIFHPEGLSSDAKERAQQQEHAVRDALAKIEQPTLVLGIESDGLFTFAEQQEIARGIPQSRLEKIDSPEGHDAFLLQFQQVNTYLSGFLKEQLAHIYKRPQLLDVDAEGNLRTHDGQYINEQNGESDAGQLTKSSVFGEAEVEDITAW
ncbi:MAG: hypothetical protein Q9159_002537 [Coniocarpon cinnabarinum]